MSITNENTENVFQGTGLTTVFTTTISAFSSDQVLVYLRENSIDTLQTLNTHYTLSGFKPVGSNDEEDSAVSVTMLSAPTAEQEVVVVRSTDKTQELALTSSRAYNPEVLMQQLDLIVMMVQEIAKSQARTFKVRPGIDVPTEIDNPNALADALDIIAAVLSGTGWQTEDPKLNAIVGATWAANKLLLLTGTNTVSPVDFTAFAQSIAAAANAGAVRTLLSLGSLSLLNNITISELASSLLRLNSEGYGSISELEIPSLSWVEGYLHSQREPVLASWDHSVNVGDIPLTGLANWDSVKIVGAITVTDDFSIQFSNDNGATWRTTAGQYASGVKDTGGQETSNFRVKASKNGAATVDFTAIVEFMNSASRRTQARVQSYSTAGSGRVQEAFGMYLTGEVHNAIRLEATSITGGYVRCYGLRRSN